MRPSRPPDERAAAPRRRERPVAVARMFRELEEQFGTLDILVNNAAIGIGHQGTFADYPLDAWQRVFAVNLDGVVHCTQAALKIMLAQQVAGRKQRKADGRPHHQH